MARRPARSRYRFIHAPPKRAMRKKTPQSAPRLYEWLVSNGYVEPVSTYRSARSRPKQRRGRRR